jgi:alkylation response protein AidB-like acyl-CoA dehydrogenase
LINITKYSFDIELKDVFVPDKNRLAYALDFASGANNVLKHSRIFVAWVSVGIAAGAYEACHKYALER